MDGERRSMLKDRDSSTNNSLCELSNADLCNTQRAASGHEGKEATTPAFARNASIELEALADLDVSSSIQTILDLDDSRTPC